MSWTRPADLRAQTLKLWDKGDLLRALIDPASWNPRRLRLVVPDSNALSEQLDAVRAWLPELQAVPHVRLVWRAFTHRLLGASTLPAECWLDTLPDALGLIGKTREARRFEALLQSTRAIDAALFTCLLPWLSKRPLAALALADDWSRLLSVLRWLQTHPRPGIYLRQVDLAGVDSKFIEAPRASAAFADAMASGTSRCASACVCSMRRWRCRVWAMIRTSPSRKPTLPNWRCPCSVSSSPKTRSTFWRFRHCRAVW